MKNKVIETIKKYNLIVENDKVVLGVSGGPDSISMLDILKELKSNLKFEIVVAHINHMIREESIEDEEYVKDYCERNNIECYVKRINIIEVANIKKIGTEEAGRNARYEFFEEILQKTGSNKIAIAHNKNDKIETIIMNLLRGSGISGLKGIQPIRDNKYIRPLIECDRSEIELYCEQYKLEPKIDRTNFENEYTRNKIRNIVIPYIKQEFNENIVETLSRLSEIATEESDFIEKQAQVAYENMISIKTENQISLNLKEFNTQYNILKSRIILITVRELIGSTEGIEMIHVKDIIKLAYNNIGNKYLTPNKKIKVLIKDKKINFIMQLNEP